MLDRKGYRYALIGLAAAEIVFLIAVGVIAAVGHEVPKELWTVGTALGGGLLGVLIPRPQASAGAKPFAEATTVHNAASTAAALVAEKPVTATPVAGESQDQADERVKGRALTALGEVTDGARLKGAMSAATISPETGAAVGALAGEHGKAASEKLEAARAPGVSAPEREGLTAEARVFEAAATAASSPQTTQAAKAAAEAAPAGRVKGGDYVAKLLPPAVVFGLALYLGTRLIDKTITLSNYEHNAVALTSHQAVLKAYLQALTSHQQSVTTEGNALIALATAAGGALVGVLAPSPGEKSPSST